MKHTCMCTHTCISVYVQIEGGERDFQLKGSKESYIQFYIVYLNTIIFTQVGELFGPERWIPCEPDLPRRTHICSTVCF